MDRVRLLSDARAARKYISKVITALEKDDDVSFLGPHVSLEQQTVEKFIEKRIGAFQADLVSAMDMCETLQDEDYRDLLLVHHECFTPVKLGRMFRKLTGDKSVTLATKKGTKRVCIIRNNEYYREMEPGPMGLEYSIQHGETFM